MEYSTIVLHFKNDAIINSLLYKCEFVLYYRDNVLCEFIKCLNHDYSKKNINFIKKTLLNKVEHRRYKKIVKEYLHILCDNSYDDITIDDCFLYYNLVEKIILLIRKEIEDNAIKLLHAL
jgi:hypothetical protein